MLGGNRGNPSTEADHCPFTLLRTACSQQLQTVNCHRRTPRLLIVFMIITSFCITAYPDSVQHTKSGSCMAKTGWAVPYALLHVITRTLICLFCNVANSDVRWNSCLLRSAGMLALSSAATTDTPHLKEGRGTALLP